MPLRCYLRSASPCFYMRKGPVPCLASNRTLHYRKTGMVTDPCSAPLCDVCDLVDHVCDLDKSIMCVILTDRAMCGSTGRGAVEGHQCTPGVRVIACMRPHTHIHTHTHTHTASNRNKAITPRRMRDDKTITPLRMHFLGSVDVCVCVYYCRTYDKAVCGEGGGQ